jgi:hypothetical protein
VTASVQHDSPPSSPRIAEKHHSFGRGGGISPACTTTDLGEAYGQQHNVIWAMPAQETSSQSRTSGESTQVVLPNTSGKDDIVTPFHTYSAQLTFGLDKSAEVNVATLFSRWVFSACQSIPHFSLLPYTDEKGVRISSTEQIPKDNKEFFDQYFHNHRVLAHGNLTGMITFQCSVTWASLKDPNSGFFKWLHFNKVYLNQTKFKTDTLVPCGFLLGAHPGFLHWDEAEQELRNSLNLNCEELPFQLSAHTVSVPVQDGKPEQYSFQGVVVETSTKHANSLREWFYELGHPKQAESKYPYTGRYQFVPFIKSQD